MDEPFLVALPASMDIYLTGGKTDDSEIRMAKFMIKSLQPGDFFIDIGSHRLMVQNPGWVAIGR